MYKSISSFHEPITKSDLPFFIHTLHLSEYPWTERGGAKPGKQAHCKVIWVVQGSGMHIVDGLQYPVKDNSVYFVMPGQEHLFLSGPDATGYVLSFRGPFPGYDESDPEGNCDTGLFYLFSQSTGIPIPETVAEEMQGLAVKMIRESADYLPLRTEMLKKYLKIFLIHIVRQLKTEYAASDSGRTVIGERCGRVSTDPRANVLLVRRFSTLLEKNFKEQRTVTEYAGQLSVTPSHLNYAVRKTSGYSAGYHIRQRIVEEAKKRAVYSDASMKEIAYQLGFEDTAHFSKFFKNVCGDNFTEFRKKMFAGH